MRKTFLFLLLFAAAFFSAAADSASGELFEIDVPVYLGEEKFLARIYPDAPSGGGAAVQAADNSVEALSSVPASPPETPLALVFSGGAARAFAHIGVLKKLEEEGIRPDFIVANSMGSIVALLYAAGISPALIEKMITEYPTNSLFRPEIPLTGGFLDTSRFISILYQMLGELDIGTLEIPVAIIAEDLVTRRQIVFMEGDFHKVLQASISMPFSFPPVRYEGMALIDGGVTNLVPLDTAQRYTDRIVVSTALYDRSASYNNPATVINRAFDIGKTRKGISQLKTIDNALIRCDVEEFSFMDFQKMDEIVKRGYESAEKALDELRGKNLSIPLLWDVERVRSLEDKREVLERNYRDTTDAYIRTGMIKQKNFSGSVFAGFEMYSGTGDDYYIDNSDYLYFGQSAEIGYIKAGLREFYTPGSGYGIDSTLDFAVFEYLVFRNRAMSKWKDAGNDYQLFYIRADLRFTDNSDRGVVPFAAWEGSTGGFSDFTVDQTFSRGGFEVFTENLFLSPYLFSEKTGDKDTSGAGLRNDFRIRLFGKIYADQKSVYRAPFDSGKTVRFYRNDGFRSYLQEGSSEKIFTAKNSIAYRTDTSLSFGEIILVKNLAASLFCDYYEAEEKGLSTGASFDLDISFLGLTSLYFTAYGGYDHNYEKVFGSVVIGTSR